MPAGVRGPNILLIVVDQQRFDCLGRSSPGFVRTPHLDQLAAGGTWFTNAFTHIPTCCPARQSLLHGGRPESFGGLWNYDAALPVGALSPEHRTWPAALAEAGYDCAHLGKWHVHPQALPADFGYHHDVPLQTYEEVRSAAGIPSLTGLRWEGGVDPAPLPMARTHWFARQAAEWIGSRPGGPWHLRLDLTEPHLPCAPVAEFAGRFADREIPAWPNAADSLAGKPYIQRQQRMSWQVQDWTWEQWQPVVRNYLAMIEQIDDALSILLDAVEGLDDTLVLYTTDHGDLTGSHGMMDKHYVMYDELVHVPLIARWPGRIPAGTVVEELVYNLLDLAPTIYQAAQLEIPDQCVGRDLLPLVAGDAANSWRTSVVATYNGNQFGLFTQRMLRTHRWKYVWNATDVDELYDLQTDPAELTNLAAGSGYSEVLGELRQELFDTLTAEGDRQVANSWIRGQLTAGRKL